MNEHGKAWTFSADGPLATSLSRRRSCRTTPFEVIDQPGELAVVAARHNAKSAAAVYQGRRNAYNFAALVGDGRVLYVVTLIQRDQTAEAVPA